MNYADRNAEPRMDAASEESLPAVPETEKPGNSVLWTVIGTVLGLLLLYAATRQVDLDDLVSAVRTANLRIAGAVLILQIIFVAVKAWRWGLLLRFVERLRFKDLHVAVYAGLAINYLIAYVGELMRSVVVSQRSKAPVSAVLASVIVERALDFIALLVLLGIAAAFADSYPEIFEAMSVATLGIVIIAVIGLFLLLDPPSWLTGLIGWLARPLPDGLVHWVAEQLEKSRQGLATVRDPRLMLLTLGVSVVQWLIVVGLMWASVLAVGQTVSWMAATLTFLLVVLGQQLPNSPLQVGTTQLAFTLGLGIDSVDPTTAVAASIIFMSFAIVPTMLIGGVCIMRGRLMRTIRLR